MKFRNLLVALLIINSIQAYSQAGSILGYISDAESKTPLAGASVNISGNKGDNSDVFGKFYLPGIFPGPYEMIISHIGYKTEIIPVEVRANLQSEVNINLRKNNLNLAEVKVGSKKVSPMTTIGAVDILLRPVTTSQDVLRIVPGLFIAQHAGGGKAEQLFLRGYDIDHGTDIAISVDGLPVNMVSHAHGQGYADLHFLIPETVEKVSFDKGPYFAEKGNLATAAFVEFGTKDFLDHNRIKLETGKFNTWRGTGLFKVVNKQTAKSRQQFYIASEYSATDGYFESPQDFHRFNMMGKYSAWLGNQAKLTVSVSTFDSKWNASGQIPIRAVKSGMITRFGSIDDSEGGNTSRTNFTIRYQKQRKNNWKTSDQFYYTRYHFNLYSNFTFFLFDPANGDEIKQRESRNLFGYRTSARKTWLAGKKRASTELGAGFRMDNIKDIELSKTNDRVLINAIQKGDIKEANAYLFLSQELELSNQFSINAGLRYDYLKFSYKNELIASAGFEKQEKGTVSPKLNFNFSPSPVVKLYLNNGIGFHSNDSRVILLQQATSILPKVYGTDLGVILKPAKSLILKMALWHLYSEQEFVYVGDEGIVEPGGKTRRMGIDISGRYQLNKWLYGDIDINLTRARAIGEAKGNDFVPLAPLFTSIGGLTAKSNNGFNGSVRYRFIGDRPANENNTVKAKGYFIVDMIAAYEWSNFEIKCSVENLFNANWREAQFDTESRLRYETDPVSEIHFTPGTPLFIKAGIGFNF